MMKNIFISVGLLLFSLSLFAAELVPTEELLKSYLERNRDLQNLAIEAKKTALTYDSTKISNGFDLQLNTGTMRLSFDSEGTSFSLSPSVTAEIPQASNLELSVSSGITAASSGTVIEDTSINASVDVISAFSKNRNLSLLKAERAVLEAERAVNKKAVNLEKEFYTKLKTLLESINSILSLKQTLFEDKIEFEQIKAKGYSTTSATYRRANMQVLEDEHNIESAIRSLKHEYAVFYKQCGCDIKISEEEDFLQLIPSDIAQVELLDIKTMNRDCFAETEAAEWTHKINTLEREAETEFSLSVNGGYTFNNSSLNSDTVDAGLTFEWGGLSLGAGTNIPITSDNKYPSFTFSAGISPNTFRKNQISKEQDSLNEEQEKLNISTARISFGTAIMEAEQERSDLLWEAQTYKETYDLYSLQEKELANYYRQGLITESEYLSAKNSMQSYQVKIEVNKLEQLIFNDDIKVQFVEKPAVEHSEREERAKKRAEKKAAQAAEQSDEKPAEQSGEASAEQAVKEGE